MSAFSKGFKELLARMTDVLKAALFPAKCLICGSFFHCQNYKSRRLIDETYLASAKPVVFERLMAPFLCQICVTGFLPIESPFCSNCGIMFKSRQGENHLCGDCLTTPKRFQIARATGIYDHALMEVIHLLKYKGKIQLGRPLGMFLFSAFNSLWNKKSIDRVVPVPLHIKRLRMRGFNQAFHLVRDWASIAETMNINLPHNFIDRHLLVRTRQTEPQIGLGRKERIANIKNAFKIRNTANITGKRILLVDDVYTTGVTVDECAKVLLKGGARQVDVLTLARSM